ncbi:MAG: hypothetical protein ABFS18_13865 [Thermodesulfobacteriota bacterium]
MKYKMLIFGFKASVLLLLIVGTYALQANRQLLDSQGESEKNFHDVASAATEVSSYAKRAEGHLYLYLMLHRRADKEKFPKRLASLHEQISILDQNLTNPEARKILGKIKSYCDKNLSLDNSLIADHDKEFQRLGRFDIAKHQKTVLKTHKSFSDIRKAGLELAKLLISLEDGKKSELRKNATLLQSRLTLFMTLAAIFIGYIGYILGKIIKEMRRERDKLKEAQAEIKVLGGMLPICASCKKVRDDKGYWNQIESYISAHTDTEFTHSYCDDCIRKLYPEFADDVIAEMESKNAT